MTLYSIDTGFFKLDGGAMFGVVPKSIWNKINPADENNLCNWALRCLLIEEGDRLILIDAGVGDKQDAKFFSHYYLHGSDTLESSLKKHGFTKEDVTDVVLTHLHFDHCGGAIERRDGRLVPAFTNATFWSTKEHWEWAVHPNDREKASFLKENILPMQESGRLQFIQTQSTGSEFPPPLGSGSHPDLLPQVIRFIIVNGHTTSMILPVIRYKGQQVVFMADLLPSQGHIPLPYVMAYDMQPLVTLDEKKAFLSLAVEAGYILFFEHDPVVECCRVHQAEKGIRPSALLKLQDL
jgi:glyoxylase-like metal-dependent hydrolase (beta-lactamase superfamily II)